MIIFPLTLLLTSLYSAAQHVEQQRTTMGRGSISTIWWKWLFVASIYFIIVGIIISMFPHSWILENTLNTHIRESFWPDGAPVALQPYETWIYGVLGTTIIGWGVVMAFIAWIPFRKADRWSWWALFAGMTIWFVPDTIISLQSGVAINAAFNLIMYLIIAIPLAGSAKAMFGK